VSKTQILAVLLFNALSLPPVILSIWIHNTGLKKLGKRVDELEFNVDALINSLLIHPSSRQIAKSSLLK